MTETSILPSDWEVPVVFRRRLGTRVGRQRIMEADGHLLLVLHAPPSPSDFERKGRFFWRQPDGNWLSSDRGSGPGAITKHLEEYASIIAELQDGLVDAQTHDEYFSIIGRLGPMRRSATNLHVALQRARDAFPDVREIIDFRDRAYQVQRNADLTYSLAKEGMEFEVAQQSELMARHGYAMSLSAHKLNMLATFFFPIVTIATVFGMNFKHGYEETAWPAPFIAAIAVGLLFGVVLLLLLGRSKKPDPR